MFRVHHADEENVRSPDEKAGARASQQSMAG